MEFPSQQRSPLVAAIDNLGRAVDGALDGVGPPRQVREALRRYERRVSDPEGSMDEWRAMIRRYGPDAPMQYVQGMERLKAAWSRRK